MEFNVVTGEVGNKNLNNVNKISGGLFHLNSAYIELNACIKQ